MRGNTYDYVAPEDKRCTKEVRTGELTPQRDRWYYLTMPDPRYIRDICTLVLREARRKVGFSQRALATASGVSLSTIAKAEQGRQNLSLDTLAKLMEAMGITLMVRTRFRSASEIGVDTIPYQYISIDVGPHDEDDHEEDDAPDPADKTEQELNEDIDRILEEVPL
jgi:transcriptional regulator with XRE-family HTH domain